MIILEDLSNQKYVICPAWPYVNAVPHLGTVLHLLSADIFVKYLKLRGADVISATGSDCHGTPIEVAAIAEGITPEVLVARNHSKILELLRIWNIDLNYSKTANSFHYRWVQDFYKRCNENGYIFSKEVEQFYCEKDDRFLPDRFVEGICPYCNTPGARGDQCDSPNCGKPLNPDELLQPACKICGNPPVLKKTTQWYYDFSAFQEQLYENIKHNDKLPENARKFSFHILDEGLKARTLTRDLSWGIPAGPSIKGAEGKSIYVWLEAVLGYVSASAELGVRLHKDPEFWKQYWLDPDSRTIFFIGKDNIFFHTLLFPALLLGTGESYGKPFVLPYNVSTTEFVNFNSDKFSKSRGIGIWIDEAAELLPTDYWRYYLTATRPEIKDTSFTWSDFSQRINTDLNDVLGNFIHRVFVLIHNYYDGNIPECHRLDSTDREFVKSINQIPEIVADHFDRFEFKKAVAAIIDFARSANTYLSTKEPWKLIKTDPSAVETILYLAAQSVSTLSIILSPIIPDTAKKIWETLNQEGAVNKQQLAEAGKLKLQPGQKIRESKPLFHKVEPQELEKRLKKTKEKSKKVKTKAQKMVNSETIPFKEFERLDIRIGTIIASERVPKTKNLLKLRVDLGEDLGERQLVAGLASFRESEVLIGQKVTVIVNLEPATIRGIRSEGMILAAEHDDVFSLLIPHNELPAGTTVN